MTDPDQRGPAVDPRHGPEPHANPGPACPHCGGGPLTSAPGWGIVCASCARVVSTSTSTSP
jgi:hypothetical protein